MGKRQAELRLAELKAAFEDTKNAAHAAYIAVNAANTAHRLASQAYAAAAGDYETWREVADLVNREKNNG